MVQSAQQTVTAQELSDRLGGKKQGKGFVAHCPCHDDQHASLSIADGDNGTILLYCHAGCKYQDIRDALGLSSRRAEDGQRLVDIYAYQDEEGQLSYEVRRYQLPDGSKDFRQRPAKASPMGPWKMAGIKPLPFDLPRLLGAVKEGRTIYYVEGEKDAQTLHKLGLFATTNHGGAKKTGNVGGLAAHL